MAELKRNIPHDMKQPNSVKGYIQQVIKRKVHKNKYVPTENQLNNL